MLHDITSLTLSLSRTLFTEVKHHIISRGDDNFILNILYSEYSVYLSMATHKSMMIFPFSGPFCSSFYRTDLTFGSHNKVFVLTSLFYLKRIFGGTEFSPHHVSLALVGIRRQQVCSSFTSRKAASSCPLNIYPTS